MARTARRRLARAFSNSPVTGLLQMQKLRQGVGVAAQDHSDRNEAQCSVPQRWCATPSSAVPSPSPVPGRGPRSSEAPRWVSKTEPTWAPGREPGPGGVNSHRSLSPRCS